MIVIISGEFVAKRLSSFYGAETKLWRTQIVIFIYLFIYYQSERINLEANVMTIESTLRYHVLQ